MGLKKLRHYLAVADAPKSFQIALHPSGSGGSLPSSIHGCWDRDQTSRCNRKSRTNAAMEKLSRRLWLPDTTSVPHHRPHEFTDQPTQLLRVILYYAGCAIAACRRSRISARPPQDPPASAPAKPGLLTRNAEQRASDACHIIHQVAGKVHLWPDRWTGTERRANASGCCGLVERRPISCTPVAAELLIGQPARQPDRSCQGRHPVTMCTVASPQVTKSPPGDRSRPGPRRTVGAASLRPSKVSLVGQRHHANAAARCIQLR